MPNDKYRQVVAEWETPFELAFWQELCQIGWKPIHTGGEPAFSEPNDEAKDLILGPVFPGEDQLAQLAVTRKEDNLGWELAIGRRPAGDPPESVVKGRERIGAEEGLFKLLSRIESERRPVADHYVHSHVDARHLECPLLSLRAGEAALLELGEEVEVRRISYSFKSGASGLSSVGVALSGDGSEYYLDVAARAALHLESQDWLPIVDQVEELVVSRVFERKGSQ